MADLFLRAPTPGVLTLRSPGPPSGGVAIAAAITRGSGTSTTTSDTFVDAGCTSPALAAGVSYLVIGTANTRIEGASNECCELEFRHGTTRIGVSRWVHDFEQFNTGDSAAGMVSCVAAVVTGDGTSTLNMRFRGEVAGYPTIRVGSQAWQTIALTNLTANVDYWTADSGSGDTAEFTSSADAEARARLVLIDSGTTVLAPGEAQFLTRITGPTSSQLGPTFQALDVRTLTASTTYTIRWEFDSSSTWNAGSGSGQVTFTPTASGDYLIIGTCEAIGTGSAFSFRRTRVFVLRLAALSAASWISNAGGLDYTDSGAGSTQECTNGLSASFTGEDVVALGFASINGANNWVAGYLRLQGSPDVDTPSPDGHFWNDGSDYVGVAWTDTLTAVSGSRTWNLLGQADSGGTIRIGRNSGNTGDSRALLVALGMRTAGGGGSTATGTFASTLPVLTMVASGARVDVGTFASTLPVPTMSASGNARHVGTFATSLPVPTMAASGNARHAGTFASTLPVPTIAAAGTSLHVGTFASTLPVPTMSASGRRVELGSFASTLPAPTMSAAGSAGRPTGTFATTLPVPAMSAAGQRVELGTFVSTLPVPTMSASGRRVELGAFASTLPVPTMAASGAAGRTSGSFASSLPVPTMAAAATVRHVGTFVSTLPVPTMSATGRRVELGSFASSLPVPTMAAVGGVGTTPNGTFASTLPVPTVVAAGVARHVGTFASSLPMPSMSASGRRVELGSFASSLPVPTMSASGQRRELGAFATTLPVPTMAAAGLRRHQAAAAIVLPAPTMSGAGTRSLSPSGTIVATVPVPAMVAATIARHGGSFAATLPAPTIAALAHAHARGTLAAILPIVVLSAAGQIGHVGTFAGSLPLPSMAATGGNPLAGTISYVPGDRIQVELERGSVIVDVVIDLATRRIVIT